MAVDDGGEARAALESLLRSALVLESAVLTGGLGDGTRSDEERSRLSSAADRLERSVIRPLQQAQGPLVERASASKTGGERDAPFAERLAQLARDATMLRVSPGARPEVLEATAALQDLACRFADDDAELAGELREIQSGLPTAIQAQTRGPYLVTNAQRVVDWQGRLVPTRPQMALCRCGGS
ncbi:MAG TPA: hypothetical protein VG275_09130, partial [Solirubrobacteraceae bacterium]|nr:hypothetical protein [Solirubrobacteraceae bacterium]